MPICCVFGCSNKPQKGSGITFHKFPKESERRKLWELAVRRQNFKVHDKTYICSSHFLPENIDRTAIACVRIRDHAVPSIFPSYPRHLQKSKSKRKPPAERNVTQPVLLDTHLTEVSTTRTSESDDNNSPMQLEEHLNNVPVLFSSISPSAGEQQSSTIPDSHSTPRKVALEKKLNRANCQLTSSRKRIKLLLQHNRRLDKRTAKFKSVISDLRKHSLLSEERITELENTLPGTSVELLKRQVSKSATGNKRIKGTYSSQLKAFAMTLHFYSPHAYMYVRKVFNTCLPHPRTISRWFQSVDGNPGFTSESLQFLKDAQGSHVQTTGHPIFCSLIMDGMAIRQHIEFDGTKYHGHVDMGCGEDDDCLPVAKNALTFMVVAINANWKIPVGYFLIDGLTGVELANIVQTCLTKLNETGIKIVSLTFDGTSANMTMARKLGCVLEPGKNMKSWFPHPVSKEPVYVFLDACHMLKLVRNTLGDKKSIVDSENNFVLWHYIAKLHELQTSEGLHLGNKLRSAHLQWQKQKMKVRLAAQVFSESVATAIDFCRDELPGLQNSFKGSHATTKFILMMNRLFDIFNSRNRLAKGWKSPICVVNWTKVNTFLSEAELYIQGLKESRNGNTILKSNRKTGFLGFLICISSLRGLYDRLICDPGQQLRYFPTYKVSQDHIELFFGIIRSKGGCNNNPTARQFMAAYKRILLHNELQCLVTGNCLPQDVTSFPLLKIAPTNNEKAINESTSSANLFELEMTWNSVQDHDYLEFLPDPGEVTEFSRRVVAYISGWIVRQLQKQLKCNECISALEGDNTHPMCDFIKSKTHGGLIYPSKDAFDVALECERLIRLSLARSSGVPRNSKFTIHALVSYVAQTFLGKDVFKTLNDHMLEQSPTDNHVILLMKAIATKYINARLHHAAKLQSEALHKTRVRHNLTKKVIFSGQ